jgi:stage V sporulation protein G
MKITEVRIRLANEELVKAYASICLDDYFLVHDIRIIKGPAGLFISFPNVTQSDGTQRDIAFPVNVETWNMIEQAVLAEYEKVIAQADQEPSEKK